jgi:hypothetical protein
MWPLFEANQSDARSRFEQGLHFSLPHGTAADDDAEAAIYVKKEWKHFAAPTCDS